MNRDDHRTPVHPGDFRDGAPIRGGQGRSARELSVAAAVVAVCALGVALAFLAYALLDALEVTR